MDSVNRTGPDDVRASEQPRDDRGDDRGDEPVPPPPPDDLPVEPAVAFGVEGYDPADPWNASLYVETANVLSVLPLTPKTLDGLLGTLMEVNHAQRSALGVTEESPEADDAEERPGAIQRMTRVARLATGSQPVNRLWNTSTRGRVIIIGFVVLFVLIGVILSTL